MTDQFLKFRTLRADEIDCRVATVSKADDGKTIKGMSLLLYKDARCDMNILDETVGCMGWQREHSRDNANCTVSIFYPELDMWVSKEDTGTDSNTEAEKGRASDSFKRACVNWGIGRELYTAPFIWIGKGDFKDKYDKFYVSNIGYDENRCINLLTIYNKTLNKKVFTYFDTKAHGYPTRIEMLNVVKAHYPDGKTLQALLDSFGVQTIDEATDAQLMAVYNKYR